MQRRIECSVNLQLIAPDHDHRIATGGVAISGAGSVQPDRPGDADAVTVGDHDRVPVDRFFDRAEENVVGPGAGSEEEERGDDPGGQ